MENNTQVSKEEIERILDFARFQRTGGIVATPIKEGFYNYSKKEWETP